MQQILITIDGPVASGKTSLSDKLSKKLGFAILHTGLIYRAIAKKALMQKVSNNNVENLIVIAQTITFQDLSNPELSNEDIGVYASKISAHLAIRKIADNLQKEYAKKFDKIIIEGRDSGSVVFPNATLKIYITADIEVRAMRRFKQLQVKGNNVIYEDVLKNLAERDFQDTTRINAPLVVPENAIIFDTSKMQENEALEQLVSIIQNKLVNM